VAYQQDVNSNGTTSTTGTFTDPLADSAGCSRDIPLLKELGTNTIRVYAINASLDHSACMQMLQDAGIYLIQDLSNPSSSINRDSPTWTTELFADYAAVVDAMANYTNVLGFFAGNEVSNDVSNTNASAFVKAAVRDMKSYIKTRYATNDNADIRIDLAHYFNCGDPADAIDFWGYNIYSWCGDSSYTVSGYDQRTAEFANYSVPVQPRQFTEVQAIYGKNMTGVWSGGIVYMYFQETNNYGRSKSIPSAESLLSCSRSCFCLWRHSLEVTRFHFIVQAISTGYTKLHSFCRLCSDQHRCSSLSGHWC
jgi:hypothetical protein